MAKRRSNQRAPELEAAQAELAPAVEDEAKGGELGRIGAKTEDDAKAEKVIEPAAEATQPDPTSEPPAPGLIPLGPPSADELFGNSPSVRDLISVGYSPDIADRINTAFQAMMEKVRDILIPERQESDSVKISSTADGGHWRLGRKWDGATLMAPDDPFLSEENIAILRDDPRIKVKFPGE